MIILLPALVFAQDRIGTVFQLGDSGFCVGVDPNLQYCNFLNEITSVGSDLKATQIYNNKQCLQAKGAEVVWTGCNQGKEQLWNIGSKIQAVSDSSKCLSYAGLTGGLTLESSSDAWKDLTLVDCSKAPQFNAYALEKYVSMASGRKFPTTPPLIDVKPKDLIFETAQLQNGTCYLIHTGYHLDGTASYFDWHVSENFQSRFGIFKRNIIKNFFDLDGKVRLDLLFQATQDTTAHDIYFLQLNNRCLAYGANGIYLSSCLGTNEERFKISKLIQ
jgi:hypothetical protein